MGLLDLIRHNKIKGPTFWNENKDDGKISTLKSLIDRVGDDQKEKLETELKKVEIGNQGEENVIYELKHSKKDMIILHDITIEDSVKDSQIDFIIITKNGIVVLETKLLTGDIEINNYGDFVRIFKNAQGKVYKKEGIYSPITQNKYHIDALSNLLVSAKLIKTFPIYSLVVIANPKTIVNKTFAKKEIKDQIVKYDQLNNVIDSLFENSDYDFADNKLMEIADFILSKDSPREYDYVKKFNLELKETSEIEENLKVIDDIKDTMVNRDDTLYEALKKYRFEKSKLLNIKPYLIFNNEQLGDLVLKKPTTKDDFIKLSGFGIKKYEEYGKEIIDIILNDGKIMQQNNIAINEKLYNSLKKYRFEKSKELNIKPYFIFNNEQLDELISSTPKSIEDLKKLKGFTDNKCSSYGEDIINIIKNNA